MDTDDADNCGSYGGKGIGTPGAGCNSYINIAALVSGATVAGGSIPGGFLKSTDAVRSADTSKNTTATNTPSGLIGWYVDAKGQVQADKGEALAGPSPTPTSTPTPTPTATPTPTPTATPTPPLVWSSLLPMPTARFGLMVASIGELLFAVGGHNGTSDTPALEMYTPGTDTWTPRAPMPDLGDGNPGRYLGTAVVIDGKLYVAGGWRTSPPLPTNSLLVYDPAADAWSTAATINVGSRTSLSGCSAGGGINRKFYLFTACDGLGGYVKDFRVYDPDTNTWSNLPAPPNFHESPGAAVIGGKLYVVGGRDASETPTAVLDVYDPVANSWATGAPMPTARRLLAAGVLDGKLYAVGGLSGAGPLDTVEVYDPATDTWTAGLPMPTLRFGPSAAVISGILYAGGGSNATGVLPTLESLGAQ
ncbi:MAG: hypothetical protein HYY31_00400 [Chloroflexi bacterium]|nr:hypothetical protein [Chloroflexota bacterium]